MEIPSEIYLRIFENLDFKTLLRCMQVSKSFLHLITNSATLQFIIELEIANQVPGKPISSAEGLEQLRRHQRAWEAASWSKSFSIPQRRGGSWVLYGGVLGSSDAHNTIHLTRLPSHLCGIAREDWKVSLPKEIRNFRDFAMDPGQDLLVAVDMSITYGTGHTVACQIQAHPLQLKTGSPHPLCRRNAPLALSLDTHTIPAGCLIQVAGDYILMLVSRSSRVGGADNDLVVWDWKKGSQVAHIYGGLLSFSPLGPTSVLIMTWDEKRAPLLATVDFSKEDPTRVKLQHTTSVQYFRIPEYGSRARFSIGEVRSDPGPLWQPNESEAPFSEDVRNRIYVLTYWFSGVGGAQDRYSLQQFVPGKQFTQALARSPENDSDSEAARIHPWDAWAGGDKSLLLQPSYYPSRIWGCYVYGQRHVAISELSNGRVVYAVFDFNEHRYKQSRGRGRRSDTPKSSPGPNEWRAIDTEDTNMYPFHNSMSTCLPGRRRNIVLEVESGVGACWPMICEDNLILVDDEKHMYYIYEPSTERTTENV